MCRTTAVALNACCERQTRERERQTEGDDISLCLGGHLQISHACLLNLTGLHAFNNGSVMLCSNARSYLDGHLAFLYEERSNSLRDDQQHRPSTCSWQSSS